jgi:hypothetical protein
MVDQLRFTWFLRCFGQLLYASKHVDQRALAHIGSADKGNLSPIGLGTFGDVGVAN